ncbi:MAG: hypothetical protein ACLQBQ_11550 [Smithella sp.]
MKQLRTFSMISCFVMILYFVIFSFSGISLADETQDQLIQKCMDSCYDKEQVCYNMTADPRRCAALYQECVDACKPVEKPSS